MTAGAEGFGATTLATDALVSLTATAAASNALLSFAGTILPVVDESVDDTDEVIPPRSDWLLEFPESALAALAESAIQTAVPAPAIMTERRIRAARGNACMAFISTPPR